MRVHYCTAHTRKLKLDLMKDDLTRHRFISQTSPSPALAGDVYCECLLPSIRPAARLNCSCFSYVKRMCSRANASWFHLHKQHKPKLLREENTEGGSVWAPKRRWREGFHNSVETSSQNNAMAQTSLSKARIALLFAPQNLICHLDLGSSPALLPQQSQAEGVPQAAFAVSIPIPWSLPGPAAALAQGSGQYSPWVPHGGPGWLAWVPGLPCPWCRGRRWTGGRGKVQLQLPGRQWTSASGKLPRRERQRAGQNAGPDLLRSTGKTPLPSSRGETHQAVPPV